MEEQKTAITPADVSQITEAYQIGDYALISREKPYKAYGAICPCCGSFFESPNCPVKETNHGVVVQICPACAQMIDRSEYKGKTYDEILNEMQQECSKRDLCFVGMPVFAGCMIRQLEKWKTAISSAPAEKN